MNLTVCSVQVQTKHSWRGVCLVNLTVCSVQVQTEHSWRGFVW